MNVYPLFRSILFRLNPERAHQLTLKLMHLVGEFSALNWVVRKLYTVQGKSVHAFGLDFKNPVGLAAGYDKDGTGWKGLACLGFGHIEIGTVTPKAQDGNPKPRVFRLKEDKALINRMGFPGRGEDFVLRQLHAKKPKDLVLGVNIGKNKDTPVELAVEDYVHLYNTFSLHADYLVVNVSSPNTVGLRRLQEKRALAHLLNQLQAERGKLTQAGKKKTPMLVKLAPDLNDAELDDALEVILGNQMDGVIATNTTLERDGLWSSLAIESGGLSGVPLFKRSLDMVSKINQRTGGKIPVIGAGGILSPTSAQQMLDAGAVLVQIYTGLIYAGPGLVKQLIKGLR